MSSPRRTIILALTGGLLFCAVAWLSTEIYLYSRNTLAENGKWVSSKTLMHTNPMGARHFLMTRNALHRNQLNLNAWHAYNEVHLNRVFQPGSIEARFKVHADAYVCLLFNRNELGYDGIRFSRHPQRASMFFRADRQGRFVETHPLKQLRLDGAWHKLALDFSSGRLRAFVDGAELHLPPVSALRRQFISFRSGRRAAAIDDLRVTDADGSVVLAEDFRNTNDRWYVIGVSSLCWLMLAAGAAWYGWLRGRQRDALYGLFAFQITFLITASLYYAFDFYYWSGRYAHEGSTPRGRVDSPIPVAFENVRSSVFGTDFDFHKATARVRAINPRPLILRSTTAWDLETSLRSDKAHFFSSEKDHRPHFIPRDDPAQWPSKRKRAVRLVFVGTSQTFGEGAEVLGEAFVAQVHKGLSRLPEGGRLETFNFAMKGSRSAQLLEQYKRYWIRSSPDVLVLNLSFNDRDAQTLSENLRGFLRLNQKAGIRTVLLVEAKAPVNPNQKQRAVHLVGEKFDVPVLDLHAHLSSEAVYDSGFLWWDFVHMTPLGHHEAATWLEERLRPIIQEQLERPRIDTGSTPEPTSDTGSY